MKIFSYKIKISYKIIGGILILFSLINLIRVVSDAVRIYPRMNDVTYFNSMGTILGRIFLDTINIVVLLFIFYSGFFYIKTKRESLLEDETLKIATWIQKVSIFILILIGVLPTIWCLLPGYFRGHFAAEEALCVLPLYLVNGGIRFLMFIGSIILVVRNKNIKNII